MRTTNKEDEMKHSLSRCVFPGTVLVLLGAVALSAWVQENPRTLYERARLLDEGNQNLAEAIRLYGQVADSAKDQPALAARALVQMGRCQERLGQAEARKAYQRVLDEYPQQLEEVKLARERLEALTLQAGEAGKPRFRKIQIPGKLSMQGSGMLSPDGRRLAFISDGSLWVVPIPGHSHPDIAGAAVRLTEPMNAWDIANVSIAWSGDGNWIGFRVAVPKIDKQADEELYVVPAEGGTPRRLPIIWKDWAVDVHTLRYAFSRDGATLYFTDGPTIEESRIYSMPTAGGTRQAVTEPFARMPAVSPDGSRIAFVRMVRSSPNEVDTRQVWMRPIQGGEPVLICETTGKTWLMSPIWSPDGSRVAFLSSEGGGGNRHAQIWIVPLSGNGKPAAPPTKFALPGQTASLLSGWTRDDKIGVLLPSPQQHALYVVPATGGKASQLTPKDAWMPSWTPDGRAIYFDGVHGGDMAAIERIPTGGGDVVRVPIDKEYEYLQPKYPHGGLSVSPDGRSLCFAGFYYRGTGTAGIFTVPVKGGTPTRLAGSEKRDSEATWSPDGRQIAFIRIEEGQFPDIFVMQSDGGQVRRLTTREDSVYEASIRWSPNGDLIAFFGRDDTLRVIPVGGGASRTLVSKVGGGLRWCGIAWSPDGNTLAYVSKDRLYKIPREGGTPIVVETGLEALVSKIAWSPDGKSIAFTAAIGGEHELWLMEDFLPLVKKGQ
jgi:Tol biopolymer transport system component